MTQVQLMLTCLCDAFYGEVGIATLRILEACGCEVLFPEEQTCCGQPPFNAGDWGAARDMAAHCVKVFDPALPVVVPSSSCAAMLRHGYALLSEPAGPPPQPSPASGGGRSSAVRSRKLPPPLAGGGLGRGSGNWAKDHTFELSEFITGHLGIESWPPSGAPLCKRFVYHRACHSRVLHLGDTTERLLATIPGIEVVPFEQAEQCCGFGGAFSITHPTVSTGIGLEKLRCVLGAGVDLLVSGDMGCLLHLNGLIARHRLPLRTAHYVEILAEALGAE